jgi:putative DNA primase/helicase
MKDRSAEAILRDYAASHAKHPEADADPEREAAGVSDDHLALEFTRRHERALLYVPLWGRWLRWTDGRWRFDDKLYVFDLARAVCRDLADVARRPTVADKVRSAATVAAVVRLAQADPRHARVPDVFDADPWLLNTPTGIINLRTGEQRPHDPAAHLTKSTAVGAAEDCPIPRWEAFLSEILPDPQIRAFVQRVSGYALTAQIREHAFFFCFGLGANGKGVLLNTLCGIFGDYATVASMETFTVNQGDRHPTDLAMLRGARLVVSQETEEGRRWAESRIKALTGGDPITARFMRADFFTFSPQFKLVIAGNHKPQLRNVDEAMRRRLHLIPFLQTIPAQRRDPELAERLREEWPGILAWALRGCLAWQSVGLQPPDSVRDATDDYFASEDAIGRWLDECCIVAPALTCSSGDLFA